jgi:hypothetical protein
MHGPQNAKCPTPTGASNEMEKLQWYQLYICIKCILYYW